MFSVTLQVAFLTDWTVYNVNILLYLGHGPLQTAAQIFKFIHSLVGPPYFIKFCYESQRRYEYSLTGTMLHCDNQLNCPWSLLHPHELRRSILSYKGIVRASSRNSLAKSSFIKKYGHSSRVSLHFEPMVWMSGRFWLIESSIILRTIYVCLSGHDQL